MFGRRILLVSTVLLLASIAARAEEPAATVGATNVSADVLLARYRADLAAFRKEFGGGHELPDVPFFQFGRGLRTKYLYKNGQLLDARDGSVIRRWNAKQCTIVPPAYLVQLQTADGQTVEIREDERGAWISSGAQREALRGTDKPVRLPDFSGRPYASVLRVLHHEILMNVTDRGPTPNFYVYKKPWYRDGAMMALALKATDNLDLVRDWIMGLTEPYDRNAGLPEVDNLGQALFLISLVSNKRHPLVAKVQAELTARQVRGAAGPFITGKTDFAEHPVYETKWAKYGLHALGLDDPLTISRQHDSYAALFWLDYRDAIEPGKQADDRDRYPYLGWALDHCRGQKHGPISNRDYPLTWETQATQADYPGMERIDPVFVTRKTCAPHGWHAAEIFLYLLEMSAKDKGAAR
jgi:hypothetical protein